MIILHLADVIFPGNNQLTSIPAEISHLRNLRELNISNNALAYLPSEMLKMELRALFLHPNPFLPVPIPPTLPEVPTQAGELSRRRSMTRVLSNKVPLDVGAVSPITYPRPQSHIPPLFELCIRVLVSPYLAFTTGAETNLAELYTLPIPGEWGSRRVPVPVEEILNACIPGSVS